MASIEDKIREARLIWFGHIRRRRMDALVRSCEKLVRSDHKRSRGSPNKSWSKVIRHDLRP